MFSLFFVFDTCKTQHTSIAFILIDLHSFWPCSTILWVVWQVGKWHISLQAHLRCSHKQLCFFEKYHTFQHPSASSYQKFDHLGGEQFSNYVSADEEVKKSDERKHRQPLMRCQFFSWPLAITGDRTLTLPEIILNDFDIRNYNVFVKFVT